MATLMSGFPASSPVDSDARDTTAKLPLGTRMVSDGGAKEWVYVRAGGAIEANEAVKCGNEDAAPFESVVKTAAATDCLLGVSGAAFSDNEYGFIQTRGECTCQTVEAGGTAGLSCGPSATAGCLVAVAETTAGGGSRAQFLVTAVAAGSSVYLH